MGSIEIKQLSQLSNWAPFLSSLPKTFLQTMALLDVAPPPNREIRGARGYAPPRAPLISFWVGGWEYKD